MKKEVLTEEVNEILKGFEEGYDGILLLFYDKKKEKYEGLISNKSLPVPTFLIIHSIIEAGMDYEEERARELATKLNTPFVLIARMKINELKKIGAIGLIQKDIFDFSIYIEGIKDKTFKRKVASSLLLDLAITSLGTYNLVMEINKIALALLGNEKTPNMEIENFIFRRNREIN